MSNYEVSLRWKRTTPDFKYETYDRTHLIRAAGGVEIPSSSAPAYLGDAAKVNPEEMFAAALSSCHMLTFLAICAKSGFVLDSYEDDAVALLEKRADNGKLAVTRVTLRPRCRFSGDKVPDEAKLKDLHEKSHRNCFIANSVDCEVVVESRA